MSVHSQVVRLPFSSQLDTMTYIKLLRVLDVPHLFGDLPIILPNWSQRGYGQTSSKCSPSIDAVKEIFHPSGWCP